MPTPPRTLKIYLPPQVPGLAGRVKRAAAAAGHLERRRVPVSEWVIRAMVEKLDRDAGVKETT